MRPPLGSSSAGHLKRSKGRGGRRLGGQVDGGEALLLRRVFRDGLPIGLLLCGEALAVRLLQIVRLR